MTTSVEAHIVTYNSGSLIEDCLSSLLTHAPVDPSIEFSIAVLDNASSDGTADLVATRFPSVRLIRSTENSYYGPASNQLVDQSTADFVLVINPDTEIESDVVTPLVRALHSHPDAVLACPTIIDTEDRVQSFVQRFPSLDYELALLVRGTKLAELVSSRWDSDAVVRSRRDELPPSDTVFTMDFVWSTAWLIRTDVARRFPFSDDFPMYDTDLDLCRRMADAGLSAIYCSDVVVRHVGGASSSPKRKQVMERTSRARYYRTYRGRAYSYLYAALASAWPRIVGVKRRLG